MSHHPTNADTDPAAGGERLSAWLDGELTEAEQREFEAELARDPALRADLEALESVVRLVREEAPTVAPPGFHGRVMARVAELEPAPQPGLVAWFTSLGRRWEAIALGGVALAALLLFVPLAQRTPPAEPTDGPPSAGAVKLSAPPTTPDPTEEPNSSVPAPLQAKNARKSSPEVPQTQVVGRARVEGPSDAANTGVQGTNLAWEPQPVEPTPGGTAEEVEVPAASAARYVVSSDDPQLKRRVLALASRYGEVRDPSGAAVTSAARTGSDELVVTVSQAELPAFARGLSGLGFDVGELPADLLAGDQVELRLLLVGGEPPPPAPADAR